nr:hypothetical protein [uncultured bacterium]
MGTDQRALVVDDPAHARQLSRILRSAVNQVDVQPRMPGGTASDWDVVVANYDVIPAEDRHRLLHLPMGQGTASPKLVVYSAQRRLDQQLAVDRLPLPRALRQRSDADGEELRATVQKLLRGDIFGLEKYFSWGAQVSREELRSTTEKADCLENIRRVAFGLGVTGTLVEQLCNVVDEWVTNAFFHAPRDVIGRSLYAHLPRSAKVDLSGPHSVEVAVCSDGQRVGVSVADTFGTLSPQSVIDRVVRPAGDAPHGHLGLYCAFEALSHFAVNLAPGERTELVGILDVRGGYRDFVDGGKSLSVFVWPTAERRQGPVWSVVKDAADAVEPARVVLLQPNVRTARTLSRMIRTAGAIPVVCASLASRSLDPPPDLVIADFDALTAEERPSIVDVYPELRDRRRLLVYSRLASHPRFAELFGSFGMSNVLAGNGNLDPHELLVTVQKILRRDVFGIDKYFPWAAQSVAIDIRDGKQARAVLDEAELFASRLGVPSRLVASFCTVVEELTSNALYNAPVDPEGRARFAHYHRKQGVVLEPHEVVRVTLCSDGRRMGVSVSDPFGSLTPEKVVSYLGKCFRRGDDQVDSKQGGAGLGLFCAFESVTNLIVNLDPGRRTEMIGLLDIRGSYRDFARRGKSFNIFVEG